MKRMLVRANEQNRNHNRLEIATNVFDVRVLIDFNSEIERMIFLERPARRIVRRHSTAVQSPRTPLLPEPAVALRRIRRAKSVADISRKYIGPEDLSAVLNNLRQQSGKYFFLY